METALWVEAGWKTTEVDIDAESLVFVKLKGPEDVPEFSLDDIWPVHPTSVWPEGLVLTRDIAYTD